MNLHLHGKKKLKIFLPSFGISAHQRFQRLPLYKIHDNGPLPVNERNFPYLRDQKACLFNARLIQRFVQNIGFGMPRAEQFNRAVANAQDLLARAGYQYLIVVHNTTST